MDINKVLEYFNFLWPRRKTKAGLFLGYLFLVFFEIYLLKDFNIGTETILIVTALLFLFFTLFWLIISNRLILPTSKILIAISLKSIDSKSQEVINQSILRMKDRFKSLNLDNFIKIIEVGTDTFDTNQQAEKFAEKNKISVILHGTIYRGSEGNKNKFDLTNFFISYSFPKGIDRNFYPIIRNDIELFLKRNAKDFEINEDDTYINIPKVANNLSDILASLTSVILSFSESNIDIAAKILESILPDLEKRLSPEEKQIHFNSTRTEAKISLNFLRSGRLRSLLTSCYVLQARKAYNTRNFEESKQLFLKALSHGVYPEECHIGLALLFYTSNDLSESRKHTFEIHKLNPNNPAYYFNMGFYAIIDKNYKSIIPHYEKLTETIDEKSIHMVEDVLNFLRSRFQEKPNEYAFIFNLGYLNWHFGDRMEGGNLLEQFIRKVDGIKAYRDLKIKAQKTISNKL